MRGLKLADLKIGHVYKCLLSGHMVLILTGPLTYESEQFGSIQKIIGRCFDSKGEGYTNIHVLDGQLTDPKTEI